MGSSSLSLQRAEKAMLERENSTLDDVGAKLARMTRKVSVGCARSVRYALRDDLRRRLFLFTSASDRTPTAKVVQRPPSHRVLQQPPPDVPTPPVFPLPPFPRVAAAAAVAAAARADQRPQAVPHRAHQNRARSCTVSSRACLRIIRRRRLREVRRSWALVGVQVGEGHRRIGVGREVLVQARVVVRRGAASRPSRRAVEAVETGPSLLACLLPQL